MKVSLIQPNLSKNYGDQKQAYGSDNRPPETGLAVLSTWIRQYSKTPANITVLNPNNSLEQLADEIKESDILGLSDWFSNHDNCMNLARKVKEENPSVKIVVGGPNASMIPKEIMNKHPYVDFVVYRDGENSLLGLVDGQPIETIPNLWYRGEDGLSFTFIDHTNLKDMPIWDFKDFQN